MFLLIVEFFVGKEHCFKIFIYLIKSKTHFLFIFGPLTFKVLALPKFIDVNPFPNFPSFSPRIVQAEKRL